MAPEQRVIATKPKIAARPRPGASPEPAEEAAPTKSRKNLVILTLVVVLALGGGAAWWFLMGPGAAAAAEAGEAVEEPAGPPGMPDGKPGKVLNTDSVSINLASGHYLRLGLGLQLSETAYKPDGAAAVDAAITLFAGRSITEVNSPEGREEIKQQLRERVWELYHGDVLDVYFTDYVTQ